MKKKHFVILLCSLLMLVLWGNSGLEADAASKATTKKKVYKAMTSVKSGKYTYYSDGKTIYREDAKGKKTKLSKYPADGGFVLKGDYIYYHSRTQNKIYRMKKNGKNQKKYSLSASRLRMVKDGYIYYNNALGLNRISTSGKTSTKKRILSYSNNMDSVIIGSRIYYPKSSWKETEDGGQKFTSYVYSVNLKGKSKKKLATFADTHQVEIVGDSRYLYVVAHLETGDEIGIIDTKESKISYKKLQFDEIEEGGSSDFVEDLKRGWPVTVIGGKLFLQKENDLYSVDKTGKIEKLVTLPKNIEDTGTASIEKQGNYYWVEFPGDDDFGYNYIYNKKWEKVKTITRKYGDVTGLKIKGTKAYVVFNKSEDESSAEKYKTYKIYNLK